MKNYMIKKEMSELRKDSWDNYKKAPVTKHFYYNSFEEMVEHANPRSKTETYHIVKDIPLENVLAEVIKAEIEELKNEYDDIRGVVDEITNSRYSKKKKHDNKRNLL